MRFTCPEEGAISEVPELVTVLRFPADVKETMDLLEGRLNSLVCPACQRYYAILTLVMVLDKDGKTALLVEPDGMSWESEEVAEVEALGYRLERTADYDELRRKVIERLDRYLNPVGPVILPSEEAPLSRSESIKRVSPFVLRLFKSHIDGFLPPIIQFSGSTDQEVLTRLESEMYVAFVTDHLQRILKEAALESKVPLLFDRVTKLVPKECLTNEVLEAVLEKCRAFVPPDENPREFSGGFMQEVLNGVVHVHAEKTNPRGTHLAAFLISAWIFSRRRDVQMDPQFLLSTDIVQRIIRFEDLWDVWLGGEKQLTKELLVEVSEMLGQYGFRDRLLETLRGKVIQLGERRDGSAVNPVEFAAIIEELLLKEVQFNQGHDESGRFGPLLEGTMRHLLQNGQQETAMRLAEALLDRAGTEGDEVALVSMAANAADALNEFHVFDEAARMIGYAVDGEHEQTAWGPNLFIYVYTVLGNTLRHQFQYEGAMSAYDLALKFVDTLKGEHEQQSSRAVLERNTGIIYRDTGRYREALQFLQNAEKRDPEDHRNQFSLAIFYQNLNRYTEALRYLDRAIEMAHGGINAPVRGSYLVARGLLKRSMGNSGAGIEEVRKGHDLLPTDSMKLRAAAAALRFEPSSGDGREFIGRCRKSVAGYIDGAGPKERGLMVVAYNELAGALLRSGATDEAKTLLDSAWSYLEQSNANVPWQLGLTIAQVCHAKGESTRAWDHLSRVWQVLEKRLPSAQEAAYSLSWMQDKDEVQSALTGIGCDLVQRGAVSPEVLPAVYDFCNGREISARMLGERDSSPATPEGVLARYRAAVEFQVQSLETFFFLERDSTILVGHISGSAVEIVGELGVGSKRMTEIRNTFRSALRMANPADLGNIEREIDGWEQVEARLSALVFSHIAADAQIMFLPGRALTGLPLHLMRRSSSDIRLIEEHVVSYSPNFTIASASHPVNAGSTLAFGVVAVTGQKDGPSFRQAALDAGARLVTLLGQRGSAEYLKQEAADHPAVRETMTEVEEIVFLCHGTTAGFEGGYGICLANEGTLPPRVLSVEEFPEHAKFVLSWRDIEKAPSVVASIACSSGLTEIGGGGVRFGLEQSLFSGGTQTIISPLWDVEQRSALAWIEQFYTNRFVHSDWPIGRAYQQTCLDMRDRFGHFFFWGPFAMNVSALGGQEAA